tara:strand:+ start:3687 stop:4640 length:954 start_codon:yes stop_codon:yes gene_type:complete
MRFKLLFIFTFLVTFTSKASIPNDSLAIKQSTNFWANTNNVRLIFTQNSFINWSAGGNNSISGILKIHAIKNYKHKHLIWSNELKANYGLNKEEKRELRKTEDLVELNSTFGYKKNIESNWYYSAKFNFKTQFTSGYKYPNNEKPISKFFAPAYLFVGVGTEYFLKEQKFKLYLSPLTNKTTFVFNQSLANEGSFGVNPAIYDELGVLKSKGKLTKMEFGSLITGEWEAIVMTNIKMENTLILYSDYLNNYGNIDVNWEVNFDLTINEHVTANVGAQLIFDDDVKHKEDINNDGTLDILGPKIQLKQLLGVGFSYNF